MGDQWPNVAFKLLKVHGSTHWWRSRGDSGPRSIEEQGLLPGWGVTDTRRISVGDERVLVPPVAAKGSYYEPSFIRRQWQEARLAVEGATKLFITGYRLSANDLATTTLISQHLASNARITVVNLDPLEPDTVLNNLGRRATNDIAGPNCIEIMVGAYEQEVGTQLMPVLLKKALAIADDRPVDARIADPIGLHVITDIREETDRLVLIASDPAFQWSDDQVAIRASGLQRALASVAGNRKPVVIRCGGADHPAFSLTTTEQPVRWATVEG
jgi:hypothetical protein